MPFFSIIIPAYNASHTIVATIKSILSQSFDDYEVLVIDDGSTDGTYKLVKSLQKTNIHVYQQKNAGVSAARNYGVTKSIGNYLLFLDADDSYEAGFLGQLYNGIKLQKFKWGFTKYGTVTKPNSSRSISFYFSLLSNRQIINDTLFFAFYKRLPLVWTGSVYIKREWLAEKLTMFDENLRIGEDIVFWCELQNYQPATFINTRSVPLYNVGSPTSLTGRYRPGDFKFLRKLMEVRRLSRRRSFVCGLEKFLKFNIFRRRVVVVGRRTNYAGSCYFVLRLRFKLMRLI